VIRTARSCSSGKTITFIGLNCAPRRYVGCSLKWYKLATQAGAHVNVVATCPCTHSGVGLLDKSINYEGNKGILQFMEAKQYVPKIPTFSQKDSSHILSSLMGSWRNLKKNRPERLSDFYYSFTTSALLDLHAKSTRLPTGFIFRF
jgi:hypothetical protein